MGKQTREPVAPVPPALSVRVKVSSALRLLPVPVVRYPGVVSESSNDCVDAEGVGRGPFGAVSSGVRVPRVDPGGVETWTGPIGVGTGTGPSRPPVQRWSGRGVPTLPG